MDISPRVLAVTKLNPMAEVNRCINQQWKLDTLLVDGPFANSIYDWWENQCCSDVGPCRCSVKNVVIDNSRRVPSNHGSNLIYPLQIVKYCRRSRPWDKRRGCKLCCGKNTRARNLNPVSCQCTAVLASLVLTGSASYVQYQPVRRDATTVPHE